MRMREELADWFACAIREEMVYSGEGSGNVLSSALD